MNKISAILLIFITMPIVACSTKPSTNYESVSTIIDNKPSIDIGTIVIRRDSGITGSACPIDVYLNGKKYARLKSGESVNIHAAEGIHILSAKFIGKGFCQDRLNETEVKLAKKEYKYYRLAMGASGDFHILPTLANPIN